MGKIQSRVKIAQATLVNLIDQDQPVETLVNLIMSELTKTVVLVTMMAFQSCMIFFLLIVKLFLVRVGEIYHTHSPAKHSLEPRFRNPATADC